MTTSTESAESGQNITQNNTGIDKTGNDKTRNVGGAPKGTSPMGISAWVTDTGIDKDGVIEAFARRKGGVNGGGDTGSPEVQIALLSARLEHLRRHFQDHPKDEHSRRGLLQVVGRRKRLLEYLRHTDLSGYRALIKELGIRK